MSEPKFTPLSQSEEDGEHMAIEDFLGCCKMLVFTRDDGDGYYATATHESDVPVWGDHPRPAWATHVVWYNK